MSHMHEDVLERAKRAKEKAAHEAMEAQNLIPKLLLGVLLFLCIFYPFLDHVIKFSSRKFQCNSRIIFIIYARRPIHAKTQAHGISPFPTEKTHEFHQPILSPFHIPGHLLEIALRKSESSTQYSLLYVFIEVAI